MAKERARETQQEQQQERAGGSGEEHNLTQRRGALPSPVSAIGSPFTLMRRFIEDLDDLFGSVGEGRLSERREGAWVPAVEVAERDGQLVVRADVPGLNKDQIKVEVEDGQLLISGERVQEHEEQREGVFRSERSYGSFFRAIPLPDGVNPEQAKATFTNGVLEITMPAPRRMAAKRIEVQEGATGKSGQAAKSA